MLELLTQLLLTVSNALLVPDIVLLLLLASATVVHFGGVGAEWLARRRRAPAFRRFVRGLKDAGATARASRADVPAAFGLPALALSQPGAEIEKTLDDLELLSERLLARLHLGIRLGPILGLAGTLIPLGPALVALSTGDVATLSSRLVVAFATTVLGLFVGGACFVMFSVRRAWYRQDLCDVEFVLRRTD